MSDGPSAAPRRGLAARDVSPALQVLRERTQHLRPLQYVVGALVVAYVVWTVPGVRPAPGFDRAFDGALHASTYALIAVLAVAWATRSPTPSTSAARALAAAVLLRALGFVLTLAFASLDSPLPYPSVADLAWVGSGLLLIVAVVLRVRDLAPRLPLLVALDALAASLLLLGTVVLVLLGPIRTLTDTPGVVSDSIAFNLVYPVMDVALLVAVAALVSAGRRRLSGADLLVVAGVVGIAVVDASYLLLLAEGQWRSGSPVAALSVLSTLTIALAVSASPVRRTERRRLVGDLPAPTPAPGTGVPAVLVALAVLGLTFTSVAESAPAALSFVACALVALARGIATFSNDREAASAVLGIATTDLRRFQALVEASTDLIGMADSEGTIRYLNPSGRRLLGLSEGQDPRSLSVATVVPGAGETAFAQRWPVLLQTGSWEGQSDLHPVDGSPPVPMAISAFVMRDPDSGRPFGLATIQRDVRDLRRQEAALRDIADQRARLLNRLVQAQEAERSQIAADVHDDSVQALAVVDLRLGVLRRRVARSNPELVETVDDVQSAVSAASDRLRHLLFDLESPAHELGLRAALSAAAEVVFADTDVDWQVIGLDDLQLGDAERIIAYRVAREAMVNARKHADPEHVTIALDREADDLVVTVTDDGRGFAPNTPNTPNAPDTPTPWTPRPSRAAPATSASAPCTTGPRSPGVTYASPGLRPVGRSCASRCR